MIKNIAERLLFPEEAIAELSECEKIIRASSDDINRAMESFFAPDSVEYLDILEKISVNCKVERKVSDMVFLLLAAIPLLEKYRDAGYSDALFDDTMADLRYKLFECKTVYGVWGTFVTFWFKGFYRLERFKIGRMQYERIAYPLEDDYNGIVKKGDIVLNCHIPSDGPMLEEDIKESLRLAYDFYKDDRMSDGRLTVMCFTWLLYPPLFKNFKRESNIKKFYDLFNVIADKPNERNPDFWRVFGVPYSPEALETVKADNSLRRAVIEHLKNGGSMGYGVGILFVDENF